MMRNVGLALILFLAVAGIFSIWKNNTDKPRQKSSVQKEKWPTYTDRALSYKIQYPGDFTVKDNGTNSIMIVKKSTQKSAGPSSFIYISVIPFDDSNVKESIYNYDPQHMETLLEMKVGEKKPLIQEPKELMSFYTYLRYNDAKLAKKTAYVYRNDQPWEFPKGTKEYRCYIKNGSYWYLIGGYLGTKKTAGDYAIAKEVFEKIINSLRLL